MSDPVAWIMIVDGWPVFSRDGTELGRVKDVLGDENADIFDGLLVSGGVVGKDRYVAAEHVAAIYEGRIDLAVDERRLEALHETAPGSPHTNVD